MKLTVFLSIFWALNLLYGEWFAYLVPSLWTCSWPHLQRPSSPNGVDYSSNYVKIAVIADPQLMDSTSLNLAPKSHALEIAQFYTDLYMRRAFLSSVLPFNPDVVLFLGDYFDGGERLSDEEWQDSLRRFKHIFDLNMIEKTSNVKVFYLSGNHDIGYEAFNSQKPEIVKRYEGEFGSSNFKITLGQVDFIAIDAQTVDGHPQGNLTSATWEFIKDASDDASYYPRVLLTHIPLYRPDWTPCGPHRSSPIINQRIYRAVRDKKIVYQNYVTENSTNDLLDLINPELVLSGHDHDQCTVVHMSKRGPVTEHTVGTVSWQQGNLYPSFMLLSARNSTNSSREAAVSTNLCFLPMQTHIYIWYLCLFAMTLVVVLLWPANEVAVTRKLGGLIRNLFHSSSNAVKMKNDDDENCEYEEMWDAEGTMHLIKKTKKISPTFSNESSTLGRGNVVMRSNVQRQTGEDVSPDVSIQIGSGRTNKSKAKMLIWRLLRAIRALSIIAVFNLTLYMFLLFKDWNDK